MSDIDFVEIQRQIRALQVQLDRLRTVDKPAGGGAPSGPAGGVLSGTYPDPGFAVDMATQAELDTHAALTTTAHGGIVASTDPRLTDSRAPNGAAGGDLTGTYPNPTVTADAITYAKMQNVSATDKLLGRSTAGAGNVEEIALTAAGRALIDDADAAAQRTTLGLGAAALLAVPIAVASGGSGADLSATGGANRLVRQSSTGAAFTVAVLAAADLPATVTLLGARVYASGNLSVAFNTTTTVLFDTERWDDGGFHEGVTNPGRLTVPVDGTYIISGHIRWDTAAGGIREMSIRLDGTTLISANVPSPAVDTNQMYMNTVTMYKMTAGQYVEMRVYQNRTAGTALNIFAAGNYSMELAITLVPRVFA